MHQKALTSLSISQARVRVSGCHQYVHSEDRTWWDERISRFPRDFQVPCNVLVTDRIPPLPKLVRNTIIDAFCPNTLRSFIKSSEPDEDCLIRPYLGRRRRVERQSKFHAFSLRNYSLHVDQIEELAWMGFSTQRSWQNR